MKRNFAGYVTNTGKREGATLICLETGAHTEGATAAGAKLAGYSLSLVEAREAVELPLSKRQEIGIRLTQEEMLDLIAGLQHQVAKGEWQRKQLEGIANGDYVPEPPPAEI